MNDLEFTFETSPWELAIAQIAPGGELDGVQFLTMMEQESEENLETALLQLDEKDILLNIDGLGTFAVSGDMAIRLRLEKDLADRNALLNQLEENDPLRLYLEEIAALPAYGDAALLAEEYRGGKEEVLPQLTNLMLGKVAEQVYNVFDPVVTEEHLELNYIKSIFNSYGALNMQMTGSGSAVFGIMANFEHAAVVCNMLRENYPQIYIARPI